jgi:tetratricopeptide (TPR) repeat protein
MTTEPELRQEKNFVAQWLPWAVAATTLTLFLITLNRWISTSSVGPVARVSGWLWQPELNAPLYWVLTYPLRWLPVRAIPIALNCFSAVCAALTLALLARSVALLPHDRTHPQRLREKDPFGLLSIPLAWLPPVLAALVCGLQLTFWENATAASSEMLDLLVFAYVIRCLLESRLDEDSFWLTRASLVYGLGMANNWAMIGFFPLFMAALVWVRGLSFFNLQFLSRMFVWGVAGLSLYLLLPLIQSFADISHVPFWPGLKAGLGGQKAMLVTMFQNARHIVLLLSLTSVLPVFILSLRWASHFGDKSQLGVALATLTFHVVHGLFLLACIWVALDPPLSPRYRGMGLPFLTFYYLGALSVGYFSGYFLLIFGAAPVGRFVRPPPPWMRLINRTVVSGIVVLLGLAPAALLYRNWPQIRISNGPMLEQFAALTAQGMTAKHKVVLSDDYRRLLICQSASAQKGTSPDCIFVDTTSLAWPDYHRYMRQRYHERWPVDLPRGRRARVEGLPLIALMSKLAETNSLYYLHPSFGYYFEVFFLEPHGLVYELKPYDTNRLTAPVPSQELIGANEDFWAKADQSVLPEVIASLPRTRAAQPRDVLEKLMQKAHLKTEPNRDAAVLAAYYSRALDYWGVEMQKLGQLTQAAAHLQRAIDVNPDNVTAGINLECNHNLQAGRKGSVQLSKSIEDEFGKYRTWDQVIGENGPFDEPNFCYEQGRVFAGGGNYRQAAQEFVRVKALAPDNLPARLWLAQLHILGRMPAEAVKIVDEIRAQTDLLKLDRTNQSEVVFVETSAHLANKDVRGAEAAIQAALEKYPADTNLLAGAAQALINYGQYTNALQLLERQLKLTPDDTGALVNKGYAFMQIDAFQKAIPVFSRALELDQGNYSALLNRAIAYLRTDQLDAAQKDYQVIEKSYTNIYQVNFGLGEIAYRKRDTNAALQYYERYLSNAPPKTEEAKLVSQHIQELRRGPQ